jgi:hypothetical protein
MSTEAELIPVLGELLDVGDPVSAMGLEQAIEPCDPCAGLGRRGQ